VDNIDVDVEAKVSALLVPDVDALAAVCADDDDAEDEYLDTGDVTIQEGASSLYFLRGEKSKGIRFLFIG